MESEIKFPDYCCFGKRQSGQLIETEDGITAVYEMFGIKVHELSYNRSKDIWTLRQFSPEGQWTLLTCYKTQDRTIGQHMLVIDDEKDDLLKLLRKQLLKFGPVWLAPLPVMNNGDDCIVYSPAGKMLAVRLLLSAGDKCKKNLETIKGLFEYHDPVTRLNLKMHDFYETSLVITRDDGSNYWHMAFVAPVFRIGTP